MKKASFALLVGFLIFWLGAAGPAQGFPWSKDMIRQPSVKPQENPRPEPEGSVPVDGRDRPMSREKAGQILRNPVQTTADSVENGKKLYNIYCALCHGPTATGGGPVSRKFVPPPNLTDDFFKKRPDGFLFETIRSGGPVMPGYRESLTPKERWDIVNYLRRLQGQ
ncbi:MAG: cytochrome c [Candidatus Tectomicrobia bacterium]|uniref:Cytochrome c n=1 Tax=Tectimicrobiota bacterium TaxID=2528274 RepID=A0A932GNK3_UNCTE|nr:cytochrome c [Candidatus Tectomicrobia bacterium]